LPEPGARDGPRLLGVLGGMGPLATAQFLRRLVELTPAAREQDHVPTVVWSCPQIPDRVAPILGQGVSPLPKLREGLAVLSGAGALAIAIPCNTAHHWLRELEAASSVPILSIIDAVLGEVEAAAPSGPVALLATAAALHARLFQGGLKAMGHEVLVPSDSEMADLLLPSIALVKRDRLAEAGELLNQLIDALQARGASAIVAACSEIPLALAAKPQASTLPIIDSLDALARASVRWSKGAATIR